MRGTPIFGETPQPSERWTGGHRWIVVSLTFVVIALLIGGGIYYRTQQLSLLHRAENDLLTIARLKVDQIAAWRTERLVDAAVLMENPIAGTVAASWLREPRPSTTEDLLTRFRSLGEHYRYRDVYLVDQDGRIRLSLRPQSATADTPTLRGLDEAWARHRPVLVDLHRHTDDTGSHNVIEVIAPVFDGERARPAGAFVLEIDVQQFLYPLVQSWPRPSVSAETLLVRRDGDHVLFLNELRHQKNTALALRIPMSQSDLPAVMAVEGQEGIVQGVDYRGVPVLAALRAVPDSPWFMVAKVDRSEALAVWRSRSALILVLLMGLVTAVVASIAVVWQNSEKTHFQRLFETEAALRSIGARHRTTLMSVNEGVVVTDAEGRVEFMNPPAAQLTGWNDHEAAGQPLETVVPLRDERTGKPVEYAAIGHPSGLRSQDLARHLILKTRNGGDVPVTASESPIPDGQGRSSGFVIVFRDQTEERLARRLTETRLALIEFAADHSLEELLVRAVDEVADFSKSTIGFIHFVEADQKTLRLQQWSTRTVEEFCTAEFDGRHYDIDQAGVWVDCVRQRRPVVHNDYASLPHKRGMPEGHAEVIRQLVVPVIRNDSIVAILGVGNKPEDYTSADVDAVAYLADVTWQIVEQKQAEETIKKMAYHDPLTGLPNRLLLNDRLEQALKHSRRRDEGMAVLMLDLDHFKDVNDTHGHAMGDWVLDVAGGKLRGFVREMDTVARIGGDEFCIVLQGLSSAEDADRAADKIVRGFSEGLECRGTRLMVTVSIGIAIFPEDGRDGVSLMRAADRALYQAKAEGRSISRRYGSV